MLSTAAGPQGRAAEIPLPAGWSGSNPAPRCALELPSMPRRHALLPPRWRIPSETPCLPRTRILDASVCRERSRELSERQGYLTPLGALGRRARGAPGSSGSASRASWRRGAGRVRALITAWWLAFGWVMRRRTWLGCSAWPLRRRSSWTALLVDRLGATSSGQGPARAARRVRPRSIWGFDA